MNTITQRFPNSSKLRNRLELVQERHAKIAGEAWVPALQALDDVLANEEVVDTVEKAVFVINSFLFLLQGKKNLDLVRLYTSNKYKEINDNLREYAALTDSKERARFLRDADSRTWRIIQDISAMMNDDNIPRLPVPPDGTCLPLYRVMSTAADALLNESKQIESPAFSSTSMTKLGSFSPLDQTGHELLMILTTANRSGRGLYVSFDSVGFVNENEVLLPPGLRFLRLKKAEKQCADLAAVSVVGQLNNVDQLQQNLQNTGYVNTVTASGLQLTIACYKIRFKEYLRTFRAGKHEESGRTVRQLSKYAPIRRRLLYLARQAHQKLLFRQEDGSEGEEEFVKVGQLQLIPGQLRMRDVAVSLKGKDCWPYVRVPGGEWKRARNVSSETLWRFQQLASFYKNCDAHMRRLENPPKPRQVLPFGLRVLRPVESDGELVTHEGVVYSVRQANTADAASEVLAVKLLQLFDVPVIRKIIVLSATNDQVYVGTEQFEVDGRGRRFSCALVSERPGMFESFGRSLILDVWLGVNNPCWSTDTTVAVQDDDRNVFRDTTGSMFSNFNDYDVIPRNFAFWSDMSEQDWAAGRKLLLSVPLKKVKQLTLKYAPLITSGWDSEHPSRLDPVGVVVNRRAFLLRVSPAETCEQLRDLESIGKCIVKIKGMDSGGMISTSPTDMWVLSMAPGARFGSTYYPKLFMKFWRPRSPHASASRLLALQTELRMLRRVSATNSRLFIPLLAATAGTVGQLRRMLLHDERWRTLTSSAVDRVLLQQLEEAERDRTHPSINQLLNAAKQSARFDRDAVTEEDTKLVQRKEDSEDPLRKVVVMVTPFKPGRNFQKHLDGVLGGTTDLKQLWFVLAQVAAGCAQLEQIQVMQADLNLNNVMVQQTSPQVLRLTVGSKILTFKTPVRAQIYDFDRARTPQTPNPILEAREYLTDVQKAYIPNRDIHNFLANVFQRAKDAGKTEFANMVLLAGASAQFGVKYTKKVYGQLRVDDYPQLYDTKEDAFYRCASNHAVFANIARIMKSLGMTLSHKARVDQEEFVRLNPIQTLPTLSTPPSPEPLPNYTPDVQLNDQSPLSPSAAIMNTPDINLDDQSPLSPSAAIMNTPDINLDDMSPLSPSAGMMNTPIIDSEPEEEPVQIGQSLLVDSPPQSPAQAGQNLTPELGQDLLDFPSTLDYDLGYM